MEEVLYEMISRLIEAKDLIDAGVTFNAACRVRSGSKKRLAVAEAWKPFRSIASLYIWRSLDNQ